MNRILLLASLFATLQASGQNLQLEAHLSYGAIRLANIGGHVDTVGNEYALVGTQNGLDIVDVTVPSNPVIKFSVPGANSTWREVKTYQGFAYVTTEGGGGLTVVDMRPLPDTVYFKDYTGDGLIAGQLNAIHALHCDTTTGFLYLYGSDYNSGNTVFIDLSDPWNPTYAGEYLLPSSSYVHDGFALNDTLYEAHIYGGFFTIVDVTDKANPVLLATQTTPTAFTHNTWLSDDHRTLFTTDENSNSFLGAYDITDPGNIRELSRFQTAPGSGSVVHNTHILNDYAVTSWYTEGVVIVDVARPDNPVEVAKYDTYTGPGSGTTGCWGVYPFLPSGTVVASDIVNGLFVLTPNYIRGCYLEGIVTDSSTGATISNASMQVLSTSISRNTNLLGEYKAGTVDSGFYDVEFSKAGYYSKTITGVHLVNGLLTTLDVELVPLPTYSMSGTVTDVDNGMPVGNVEIILDGPGLHYSTMADTNGIFLFPAVVPETYDLTAGTWGYRSFCSQLTISSSVSQPLELERGYYDDFTFDYGWTVSGTSLNSWERGEPVGTYDGTMTEINPDLDVTGDCSTSCYVTDNGGAPYNSSDVDDGNTVLVSPYFDATIYSNPVLSYYYRYLCIAGLGTPNDNMTFRVTNGTDTVLIQSVGPFEGTNGSWVQSTFPLSGLITLTDSTRLIVDVRDEAPGNIVEGALDEFRIDGQITIGVNSQAGRQESLNVYPNPFSGNFIVDLSGKLLDEGGEIILRDLTGRVIFQRAYPAGTARVEAGKGLSVGIYLLTLQNNHSAETLRVIRQ